MKKFYLVRHAKSDWGDPRLKDIQRPLNKRGQHDAPLMAKLLHKNGVHPAVIISSPAVRAITTARIFAKEMNIKEANFIKEPQIYEASLKEMLDVIGSIPDEYASAMIFGHNPTFTFLANYFHYALDNLPTCGVVTLESEAESWLEVKESNTKAIKVEYPKMYFYS